MYLLCSSGFLASSVTIVLSWRDKKSKERGERRIEKRRVGKRRVERGEIKREKS